MILTQMRVKDDLKKSLNNLKTARADDRLTILQIKEIFFK